MQLPTLEYDEPEISNYSKLLKHISWQKIQFNKSKHWQGAQNKADRQTRQASQLIDVPAFAANIFVVATNSTNKAKQGILART